jgi:hypothetical protein
MAGIRWNNSGTLRRSFVIGQDVVRCHLNQNKKCVETRLAVGTLVLDTSNTAEYSYS